MATSLDVSVIFSTTLLLRMAASISYFNLVLGACRRAIDLDGRNAPSRWIPLSAIFWLASRRVGCSIGLEFSDCNWDSARPSADFAARHATSAESAAFCTTRRTYAPRRCECFPHTHNSGRLPAR